MTYVKEANDELAIPTARKKQGYAAIQYLATRNNNTPRQLAIPHPEAYWDLCVLLKEYWNQINEHIGRPTPKVNYCHIRRCKGAKCIFKMNYSGSDKWRAEELELDYALGSRYVVNADISNFFPSIYSHSLPWALKGKEWAKSIVAVMLKKGRKRHLASVVLMMAVHARTQRMICGGTALMLYLDG